MKRQQWIMQRNMDINNGYNEGIEQGIEQKQLEIVRRMLEEKADIDFIIRVTGLSKEKIEQIANEN